MIVKQIQIYCSIIKLQNKKNKYNVEFLQKQIKYNIAK